MKQQTSVELIRRVFDLLDNYDTTRCDDVYLSPVESYTGAQWLALEKQVLFKEYPLLAAFSCDLPNPGDFVSSDDMGVPIVLVRDRTGEVNAFYNTCRHRGSKLVSGCGQAKTGFSCPYHAWRYSLHGELAAIPDEVSFEGVDKSANALVALPIVEKYGLIWVCPSPGKTFDIDAQLGGPNGGLVADLESYEFANYYPYDQRRLRRKMNWKLMLDTFLEPYHFAPLHPTTVGPLLYHNLCLVDTYGQNLREAVIRKSIEQLRDEPEDTWDFLPHSALSYVLFPNTCLVMQRDHAEVWRAFPAGDKTNECIVQMDYYIPEPAETQSARDHWERNMDLAMRTVVEEDIPGVEGMQQGLASGAMTHCTFGRNEPALIHFEREIAKSIGRA